METGAKRFHMRPSYAAVSAGPRAQPPKHMPSGGAQIKEVSCNEIIRKGHGHPSLSLTKDASTKTILSN
eukprot:1996266-Amphidinium_carterae.1